MLALVTDAFAGRGGIARYNRDLLSALVSTEAVSSITVLPRGASNRANPPRGIQQMRPRRGRVAYSFATIAAAIARQVDIVFCGHLYMAPLAALVARLKRAKLIVQTHGIEAWTCPGRHHRAAIEKADLVLCVSRYTRSRILSWAAIDPERVAVLPNTIGDMFVPGGCSTLRDELGLKDKRVLLTVARMDARERYKGHDLVIAALPRLVAGGYDVAYVVIGEGDDLPRLRSLAVQNCVEDRVRFVGAASSELLVRAYRSADIFVMPSTGEGFGIAFVEAMASGIPALGLASAGALDALVDGSAVDESDFVQALERALRQPKPDGYALSAATRARFGRDPFSEHAKSLVQLVQAEFKDHL